jgi:hypothetical protein
LAERQGLQVLTQVGCGLEARDPSLVPLEVLDAALVRGARVAEQDD